MTSSAPALNSGIEIERKFAVTAETKLPQWDSCELIAKATHSAVHELAAVYFDTADFRLLKARITLRRRTGGKDAGWHVKLPAGGARREIQAPLGELEFTPPAEILQALYLVTRGQELIPIAEIDNERHEYLLYAKLADDTELEPVLEFVDDHVTSFSLLPEGESRSWREWECEVLPAGAANAESLLQAVTPVIQAAGARSAKSPSKLAQALGPQVMQANAPLRPLALPAGSPATALVEAIRRHHAAIYRLDPQVRGNSFDAIHQMRVNTRGLRSVLSTMGEFLDPAATAQLSRQLQEFAQVLGAARDAEVVATHLKQTYSHPGYAAAAVSYLQQFAAERFDSAHAAAVAYMNSAAYWSLLDELDRFAFNPPLARLRPTKRPQPSATPRLPELQLVQQLQKACEKTLSRGAKVYALPGREQKQRDVALHSLRKSVKKLRYTANSIANTTGIDLEKLLAATKQLQENLGTYQDSVTARQFIADAAAQAHGAGEDTFEFGILFAAEISRGQQAVAELKAELKQLSKSLKSLQKMQAKAERKYRQDLAEAQEIAAAEAAKLAAVVREREAKRQAQAKQRAAEQEAARKRAEVEQFQKDFQALLARAQDLGGLLPELGAVAAEPEPKQPAESKGEENLPAAPEDPAVCDPTENQEQEPVMQQAESGSNSAAQTRQENSSSQALFGLLDQISRDATFLPLAENLEHLRSRLTTEQVPGELLGFAETILRSLDRK